MTAEPTQHRNPLIDAPRKKKKLSTGAMVGIAASVIVHALAGLYLYKAKFEIQPFDYVDEAVDVELIELPETPPPPPPPPPPPTDQPPPPKLQVREPVVTDMAPPVTVNIEPVKKEDRREYEGPPVVTQSPPPPPAPPAPPKASVITNVQWSRPPRTTERDFPQRALDRGVSGTATVECTVGASGRPEDCSVVSESPSGMGFGSAAVRIIQRGQLSPRTVDGAAQNAKFRVTLPFNLGE